MNEKPIEEQEEEKQLWLGDKNKDPKIQKKSKLYPCESKLENQLDIDWIFGKQKPKI